MSTNIATVNPMVRAQAGRIADRFSAKCMKFADTLPFETVQIVSDEEMDELVSEMLQDLRKRVERRLKTITRHAVVDLARTPDLAITMPGRKKYVTDTVVAAMPRGNAAETDVHFFKPDPDEYTRPGWISDDDLDKAYARRGLKPVDPFALAAVNESDPAFSDERPNATHWKDAQGNWCYEAFSRWSVDREVGVNRNANGWDGGWWFAGVRK